MRIGAVELEVAEPDAYAAFLGSTLGLPSRRDGDSVVVRAGRSSILLRPGAPAVQHLAFEVRTGGFDAAVAALAARVPLLDIDGRTEFAGPGEWDSRSVYCSAPDGHVLELIERQRLPRGGPAVTALSEVGIAADDVPEAVAALTLLGLPPFGVPGHDFAAVGDDAGLLIVASTGRPWLPTSDRRAVPAPLTVWIEGVDAVATVGSARIVSRAGAAG